MWPRAAVCAARIKEVLDTPSSVTAPPVAGRRDAAAGTLRDAQRRASATRVRRSRSSTTSRSGSRPGQTLAIVGSTGAGKTTLIGLAPRLYDATGGEVIVNGVNVRDVDPEMLWSHIGLVPQTPVPLLGHGGEQPALRQRVGHRRGAVGRARDRAGARLRRRHARRARRADRAGRHERVGRPAPTAGDRACAGEEARHLLVRRLLLGARPRH